MKIYIHTKLENRLQQLLKNHYHNHILEFNIDEEYRELSDFEVLVGYNIPLQWISRCNNLKLIQADSAGVDHYIPLDWHELRGRGVGLANFAGFYDKSVTEDVLCALLMILRSMPLIIQNKTLRTWDYMGVRNSKQLLHNKNVVLLGHGNIGKEIAHSLQYFNCNIIPLASKDFIEGDKSTLLSALSKSSILISTLPLNKKTKNLIDYDSLKKLGKKGIVINVGRGGTINEDELVNLLLKQELYAAYLDVTTHEPIPKDSKLWDIDNLFLGQHGAGGMECEEEEKIKHLIYVLDYFIKEGKPFSPIEI